MKNFTLLSFILTILILSNACNHEVSHEEKQSQVNEITVDISKSVDRNEFIHEVYAYISDIEFIKLETPEKNVIKRIEKMLLHKNKFIIMQDLTSPILIFSNDGSFHKSIDQFGKGPGELYEIRDIVITHDNLAILDYNKIHYCSQNYEILKSELITDNISREEFINPLKFHKDNHYTYLWSGSLGSSKQALTIYNTSGKETSNYFAVKYLIINLANRFSNNGSRILLNPPNLNDTIFEVKEGKLIPIYYLNFKENKREQNQTVPTDTRDIISLISFVDNNKLAHTIGCFETNNILFFNYTYLGKMRQGFYHKKEHKTVLSNELWFKNIFEFNVS
ncbi:MAG: 6-bladed beta-propeller, partial [Tissierellia bacterium]|nr:6-bladed beta-propeller [Tissierellia bacterium]